ARARQTGNLQVPRLHPHLRTNTPRALRAPAKNPRRPHAGEAQGNQEGAATADAPANPRTREMAEASRDRLPRVSCGADKQPRTRCVPVPRHGPVATLAQTT